jgi:integrase
MSKPLTALSVAKFKPAASRQWIKDGTLQGLYLVIQPQGSQDRRRPVKTFAMRFRDRGKIVKLTLGRLIEGDEIPGTPVIGAPQTLSTARLLAVQVLRQRALGEDVVGAARAAKRSRQTAAVEAQGNTFAALVADYVDDIKRQGLRGWARVARNLGLDEKGDAVPNGLVDRWAAKQPSEITDADAWVVINEARLQGVPGLARGRADGPSDSRARYFRVALSGLFSWGKDHRRVAMNPVAAVAAPAASKARDRVLSNTELRLLWQACDQLEPPWARAIRLLSLTGQRLNEIAAMGWSELIEGGAVLSLPSTRTKNGRPHLVPLPQAAQEIIASVPRIEGSSYVFTVTGKHAIAGWDRAKRKLDAAMLELARKDDPRAEIAPWRIHDVRRTVASGLAGLGVPPVAIEATLNHVSGARASVAGVYNRHSYSAEKKAALDRWAQHVAGIVSDRPANIVSLDAAGRR